MNNPTALETFRTLEQQLMHLSEEYGIDFAFVAMLPDPAPDQPGRHQAMTGGSHKLHEWLDAALKAYKGPEALKKAP